MYSLSDFISRERGEVILDIDDENGNTLSSTEYPKGTHANKVLQDIRNYFQSGQTPQAGSEPTVQQFRLSPETQGANARQLGNNEPSPHQSPTATASPQGEAMGAAEAFKPYDYDKLPGKARRWIRQRGERDRQ